MHILDGSHFTILLTLTGLLQMLPEPRLSSLFKPFEISLRAQEQLLSLVNKHLCKLSRAPIGSKALGPD